jgi:uncharacterized protein
VTDITPAVPAGRQIINGYGRGKFRIAGEEHAGSVIVLRERTFSWPVGAYEEVTAESLAPVTGAASEIEVLLLGCGPRMAMPSPALREHLRGFGIVVDTMDTGAACRTFNVLLSEDRAVAAALIAID